MDARQMVALRKALGAAPDAGSGAGPTSPDAGVDPVKCPECGCEFVPEPAQPAADLPVDA